MQDSIQNKKTKSSPDKPELRKLKKARTGSPRFPLEEDPGFDADIEDALATQPKEEITSPEEDVFLLFAPQSDDESIFSVIVKEAKLPAVFSSVDSTESLTESAVFFVENSEEDDEEIDEETSDIEDIFPRPSSPMPQDFENSDANESSDDMDADGIVKEIEGPSDAEDQFFSGDIDYARIARSDDARDALSTLLEKDISDGCFSRLTHIAAVVDEGGEIDFSSDLLDEALELAVTLEDEDAIRQLVGIGAKPTVVSALRADNDGLVQLMMELNAEVVDWHVTEAVKLDSRWMLATLEGEITQGDVQLAVTASKTEALTYFLEQNFYTVHEWALQSLNWDRPDCDILSMVSDSAIAEGHRDIDPEYLEKAMRARSDEAIKLLMATGVQLQEEQISLAIEVDSEKVLQALELEVNDDNVKMAASNHWFNALKYFMERDFSASYPWVLQEIVERDDAALLENLFDYITDDERLKKLIKDILRQKKDSLVLLVLKNFGVSRILDLLKSNKKVCEQVKSIAISPWTQDSASQDDVDALSATFEDRMVLGGILLPYPGKTVKGRVNPEIEDLRKILSADTKLSEPVRRAASLIGVSLSIATRHFPDNKTPGYQFSRTKAETYLRSEKSDFIQHFGKKAELKIKPSRPESKVSRGQGVRASMGLYAAPLDTVVAGDAIPTLSSAERLKPVTTVGNGQWYDSNLAYRHKICRYIMQEFGQTGSAITPGFYHDYPCLMVHVKNPPEFPPDKALSGAMDGWTEMVISFYMGIVNFITQNQGLPLELVRRSSFGALTPTIAACKKSFRINVGLIPKDYAYVLAKSLIILDQALHSLYTARNATFDRIAPGCFLLQEGYPGYLGRDAPTETSLFRALWLQVENKGKRMTQNIVRSAFGREGLAAEVYRGIQSHYPRTAADCANIFLAALSWAVNDRMKLFPPEGGPAASLSFDNSGSIKFEPLLKPPRKIQDEEFFKIINALADQMSSVISTAPKVIVDNQAKHLAAIKSCIEQRTLVDLYFHLEFLNEIVYSHSIFHAAHIPEQDMGSDSDVMMEEKVAIYGKKFIVANGMRAIWSGLHVVAEYLATKDLRRKARVYLHGSYYEVEKINLLEKHSKFSKAKNITQAEIFFHDVNHCATLGESLPLIQPALFKKFKALVLDTTSASIDECRNWINLFKSCQNILVLVLVSSGFKHEQIGSDKNQYGTVRLFAKDKEVLAQIYKLLTEIEEPIKAAVSHSYRRLMKKLGFVPTNTAILGIKGVEEKKSAASMASSTGKSPLLSHSLLARSASSAGSSASFLPAGQHLVDVPSDNHCLFWSAVLALLLPRLDDAMAFKTMYLRLFGHGVIWLKKEAKDSQAIRIEADHTIEGVRSILQGYDCGEDTLKHSEGGILTTLVKQAFRRRVVEMLGTVYPTSGSVYGILIAANLDNSHINSWEDYCKTMLGSAWGGEPEVMAISRLAQVNVRLYSPLYARPRIFDSELSEEAVSLVHVNAGASTSRNKNHYNFLLPTELYLKHTAPDSSPRTLHA